MKEKERKFLLNYMPAEIGNKVPQNIEQGYLFLGEGKQLRIRIVDNESGWLCYKTFINSIERNEYEYLIPINDAYELMQSTSLIINKVRYKLSWRNFLIDIDVYDIFNLKIVEIEGEGVEELTEFPPFFGVEITGNEQYSNVLLAKAKLKK